MQRLRLRVQPTTSSPSRLFSTSSNRLNSNYEATLQNLRIGAHSRVIFQGFTGRQATANAKESIAWGTNVVGGVTPGRESTHLGLPVLPSVRRAVEELKPDATGIYVPASAAVAAIEEAIEAEIPLIVAVAEHIPLHDMLRIHSMLKTQRRSRLVGPNSPGIISAADGARCRIGFQPLPCFSSGCVGIAAKSGTLSYEAVAATTRAGLGQSLRIGVGGDMLPGTDLREALTVLLGDENTRAIVLIGELGGEGEVTAAELIREYHSKTPEDERKPIAALVAGLIAPRDTYSVMGHAGAIWLPSEPNARQKVDALRAAGILTVRHPAQFGDALQGLLKEKAEMQAAKQAATTGNHSSIQSVGMAQWHQRRKYHSAATSTPLLRSRFQHVAAKSSHSGSHQRRLHLDHNSSVKLFKKEMSEATGQYLQFDDYPVRFLSLGIDRETRAQCITTGIVNRAALWNVPHIFKKVLLPHGGTYIQDLNMEEFDTICHTVLAHLKLQPNQDDQMLMQMRVLLRDLDLIFRSKEAKVVSIEFHALHYPYASSIRQHRARIDTEDNAGTSSTRLHIHNLSIDLDDAAPRSAGRLRSIHHKYTELAKRSGSHPDGAADDAGSISDDGIVYHRLQPSDHLCNIGTLVNGAGLAMNTVDALGGRAANFLDTGGKATAQTIRKAFELILHDARVKCVFVNIFGGLTLGDMIASGIILAFKELSITVPVVVRIRGTNEASGQQMIAESGLSLFAFDDFDEAALKAIELADNAEVKLRGLEEVVSLQAAAANVAAAEQEEESEAEREVTAQEGVNEGPRQEENVEELQKPWKKW